MTARSIATPIREELNLHLLESFGSKRRREQTPWTFGFSKAAGRIIDRPRHHLGWLTNLTRNSWEYWAKCGKTLMNLFKNDENSYFWFLVPDDNHGRLMLELLHQRWQVRILNSNLVKLVGEMIPLRHYFCVTNALILNSWYNVCVQLRFEINFEHKIPDEIRNIKYVLSFWFSSCVASHLPSASRICLLVWL